MSFLLGAFGKLAAGRRVRDLQARMMRVQSRLRRATRQIETTSKMLESQKKFELNSLSLQSQYGSMFAQNNLQSSLLGTLGDVGTTLLAGGNTQELVQKGLTQDQQTQWLNYQNAMNNLKANNEIYIAQAKMEIESKYENLNDILLEPLKMEEDSLQTEKDSLESQLQIAQADYKACQEMEKSDAKNLAPNYTGGG